VNTSDVVCSTYLYSPSNKNEQRAVSPRPYQHSSTIHITPGGIGIEDQRDRRHGLPRKAHNFYTHLYNKVVFDVLKERFGEHKAALFARSATADGQRSPIHWGGDCESTYEAMAEVSA
jgi:alpha-glucosidase (family GH31 glycosyl hydrolase)